MTWTSPKTWAVGEVVTAANMNTHVRDNLNALRPGYGTSLPASPGDGDEYVLVDSTTAPTFAWQLRYNGSSTNADKWEFIGGSKLRTASDGSVASGAGSAVYGGAQGLTATMTRAGVYDIRFGGTPGSNSSGTTSILGVGISGAPAAGDEITVNNTTVGALSLGRRKTITAGQSADLYIKDNDSTRRISFSIRWIEIEPVRLS